MEILARQNEDPWWKIKQKKHKDKPFEEQEGRQAGVRNICVYNMTY